MLDPAIATHLVITHQRGLYAFLRMLGCHAQEAEDISQETFLTALRGALELRSDEENGRWLRGCARRMFLARLRDDRRRADILEQDAAESLWQRLLGSQEQEPRAYEDYLDDLARCLQSLTDRAAEAIRRHYCGDEQGPRIAHDLQLSTSAYHTLLHRARESLKQCLEARNH